jgi:glycosyltransferase involved in cell wall biosynthesis
LNILHVINYYQEGFGYQENYLTYYQKKASNNVLVISSDYFFPFPDYDSTMLPTLGNRRVGVGKFSDKGVKIIRKKSFFSRISPGIIWFNFSAELKNFKPDVVHLHGATNIVMFQLLYFQKKYGFKIFVDSHQDKVVENSNKSAIYAVYYWIWRFIYNKINIKQRVSRFLPITESAQEWLLENLEIVNNRTTIVPLGVDLETMSYCYKTGNSFKERYNIQSKIVLVNAGKQYEKKKIEWVIKVAVQARHIGVDVFLILVGSANDSYNLKIENSLKSLGRKYYLRLPFLNRKELREVYSASDIGIWPGVPSNTIQEAMACNVAVILPNDNIVGHLVDGNGILENKDIDRTTSFIEEVSKNHSKLNDIKKQSKKIAERYSWKEIVSELDLIYEKYE